MNFEQPPQTNNNEEEKMSSKKPAYYEYTNPNFLDEVKEFERTLPDNPEAIIGWRDALAKESDDLAAMMVKDKSVKEEYHMAMDKIHAINRRLNLLGYEEK
jgi:uncharacterized membrane protein